MNKKENLEEINKLLIIECSITRLKRKYEDIIKNINDNKLMLDFLFEKLINEEGINLNHKEIGFFGRACLIPYHDIKDYIISYDKDKSKIDDLELIKTLQEKYEFHELFIYQRVKDVRKIDSINKKRRLFRNSFNNNVSYGKLILNKTK